MSQPRKPLERVLYTKIDEAIHIAAQFTTLSYNHSWVNEISDLPGFPASPEKTNINVRTDNYVLITDQMQQALTHLMEARKCLLLLGIQGLVFSQEKFHEKEVPSDTEDIRFEL
jgi:hypothetical protein